MFLTPILISFALASDPASWQKLDRTDGQPTAMVPVGKDTTVVTGPLDQEGYIDYITALNECLAKNVVPEKNASILLWKTFGPHVEGIDLPDGFFKQLGMERPPDKGDYLILRDRYLKDTYKLTPKEIDGNEDQISRACKRPWSAKDYPYIASWLLANEKPLALAIQASKRRDYFNPLFDPRASTIKSSAVGMPLPQSQQWRGLITALTARAMLRLHDDKSDAAWQDLLACHRLARLLSRGPTVIETLLAIAFEGIANQATLAYLDGAKLTANEVRQRLNDLRGLPGWPSLAEKADLTERFSALEELQYIRRYGSARTSESLLPKIDLGKQRDQIDWEQGFRNFNQWSDRYVAALCITDPLERRKELTTINAAVEAAGKSADSRLKPPIHVTAKEALSGSIGDVLAATLLPILRAIVIACDRSEQYERNSQIVFALAAYRLENARYPKKLDELVPRYLGRIPDDVFSGKPPIYKPSASGYLLYSVGPNGKDDGGRWIFDEPPGDDIAVRMPMPPLGK
jgi:hypothetical protein